MTSSSLNGNELELRTLAPNDYDAMVSVWKKAGLSYRPQGRESREEVERQMALDPEMWLGCFVGRDLVGVIIGSYDSRKAWLNRLAVVPEHQGKGVGRAVVSEMEGRLRARGFRIIGVLIEEGHDASHTLFSNMGYTEFKNIRYLRKLDDPEV